MASIQCCIPLGTQTVFSVMKFKFNFNFKTIQAPLWGKVHIFWEGHKILRNLHQLFDWQYIGQIIGGDFAKFFGLFRIYELYDNAILAIDIKSVSLNVKVQSALGLVLCNFSWYIFPGGPFKSTTEKREEVQWKHDHKSRFGIVYFYLVLTESEKVKALNTLDLTLFTIMVQAVLRLHSSLTTRFSK